MKYSNIKGSGEILSFTIRVKTPNGNEWDEEHESSGDPEQWAKDTVDRFNRTLRPGEAPRELVSVIIHGESGAHRWAKSSRATGYFRGRPVDIYRCLACGITGKRYGLSQVITIDSKYRAKKFEVCDPNKSKDGDGK